MNPDNALHFPTPPTHWISHSPSAIPSLNEFVSISNPLLVRNQAVTSWWASWPSETSPNWIRGVIDRCISDRRGRRNLSSYQKQEIKRLLKRESMLCTAGWKAVRIAESPVGNHTYTHSQESSLSKKKKKEKSFKSKKHTHAHTSYLGSELHPFDPQCTDILRCRLMC